MSRSESSPTERRALRWILWLAAGVLLGMFAGFAVALAGRGPDLEPSQDESGSQPSGVGGASGVGVGR